MKRSMRTRIVQTLPALALSFSALLLVASCGTVQPARVVTETEAVEVEVEVFKPLPDALVRPVPYPPALPANFTVEDTLNLAFDLYDALDQANADKERAGLITQPQSVEEIPQ